MGKISEQSPSWAIECAVDIQLARFFSPDSDITLWLSASDGITDITNAACHAAESDADVLGMCFGIPEKFVGNPFYTVFRHIKKPIFAPFGNDTPSPYFPACLVNVTCIRKSPTVLPPCIFHGKPFMPRGSSAYTAARAGIYAQKDTPTGVGAPEIS